MESSFLKTLKEQPENAIEIYNLVYSTPDILSIKRHRNGKNFKYSNTDNKPIKGKDLERIKALIIPPAWQKVKIAHLENAHLQAIGRDIKNRKQYKYHSLWIKIRNQTKFYKMLAFAEALPNIRKRVEKDINQTQWTKTKVLALIIRLLEESHIRIGNDYYAKRNKTYGLSTLRTRHVDVYKDRIKFEFIGKKGKEHQVTIRNKKLARLVNRCEEIPGWELFQYFDSDGNKQKIDSAMVNEYIHQTCGDIFSAKDFRTWSASLIAFDTLSNLPKASTIKQKEKIILKAIDTASEALNNTRTVCRKYYVHPIIPEAYLNDAIFPYFEFAEQAKATSDTELQPNELALKKLLATYKPQFLES